MPPRLPDLANWSFAAVYEPAGEAVLVGGDFYDWFMIADGRLVFLIGDVCGNGPAAGTAGFSIRKALKGVAAAQPDPALWLDLVERAVEVELAEMRFASVLVAILDRQGGAELHRAGHPLPWMLGRTHSHVVGVPGRAVLGVGSGPAVPPTRLRLEPGETMLMFTDGLVEARAPGGRMLEAPLWDKLSSATPFGSAVEVVLTIDAFVGHASETGLKDDAIYAALTYTGQDGVGA